MLSEVYHKGRAITVHKPVPIRYVEREGKHTYVFIEEDQGNDLPRKTWKKFAEKLNSAGIYSLSPKSERELNSKQADAVENIWSE
jgi:hypothetical protein